VKQMVRMGVDGCRGGWLIAKTEGERGNFSALSLSVVPTLGQAFREKALEKKAFKEKALKKKGRERKGDTARLDRYAKGIAERQGS